MADKRGLNIKILMRQKFVSMYESYNDLNFPHDKIAEKVARKSEEKLRMVVL